MNELIEKVDNIMRVAIDREKWNDRHAPELTRQLINVEELEWLCETVKELVHDCNTYRKGV